jgi:hypothetical protein
MSGVLIHHSHLYTSRPKEFYCCSAGEAYVIGGMLPSPSRAYLGFRDSNLDARKGRTNLTGTYTDKKGKDRHAGKPGSIRVDRPNSAPVLI